VKYIIRWTWLTFSILVGDNGHTCVMCNKYRFLRVWLDQSKHAYSVVEKKEKMKTERVDNIYTVLRRCTVMELRSR